MSYKKLICKHFIKTVVGEFANVFKFSPTEDDAISPIHSLTASITPKHSLTTPITKKPSGSYCLCSTTSVMVDTGEVVNCLKCSIKSSNGNR